MKNEFTAFSITTGEVLFSGTSEDPDVLKTGDIDILKGEKYTEGYFVESTFFAKPALPSAHHIFNYTTKQWIDPRTPETEWPLVRSKRDQLLAASDWTQLPDVPLTTKEAWATYRQALRDITLQADPFNIVWPVGP